MHPGRFGIEQCAHLCCDDAAGLLLALPGIFNQLVPSVPTFVGGMVSAQTLEKANSPGETTRRELCALRSSVTSDRGQRRFVGRATH